MPKRYSPRWWISLPNHARNAWRRLNPRDPQLQTMAYWWYGTLERQPIETYLADVADAELTLVKAGRRTPGTSITAHELVCLAMAVRSAKANKVLEIGTFDGNTSLNFAANLVGDGRVVTIDLPLDYSKDVEMALEIDPARRNVTPRDAVGVQYRGHPLEGRIKQIYGDSANLDFSALGGPFDLAFVDGCHAYEYVVSDTNNVIPIVRPGGLIVWHDYCNHEGVARAVDSFRDDPRFESLVAIEESRLAIGRLVSS